MPTGSPAPPCTEAYPAIYDFSTLPYALGDILTWSVKTLIRARQGGFEKVDLYLCCDALAPASVPQRAFITPESYQLHLLELLPAFHCNPLVENLHIFTDRREFAKALTGLGRSSNPHVIAALRRHEEALSHSDTLEGLAPTFHREVTFHDDINAYHAETGFVPRLASSSAYLQEALSFRKNLGENIFVVAMQFRMRQADVTMDGVDPERDADYLAWFRFLDLVHRKFPHVRFLLLGKLQEKPVQTLGLPNVIAPRLLGMSLGHELALIQISDFYLGSTSGFAAMAMFSDVPYCITKFTAPSCEIVGIPPNGSRLPFGHESQVVTGAPETQEMLLAHFLKPYRAWLAKRNDKNEKTKEERDAIGLATSQHFQLVNRSIEQLRGVPLRSMTRAVALSTKGEHVAALSLIDQALQEMPEVCACLRNFHLNRAVILGRLQRWSEAHEAALQEIAFHPGSPEARQLLEQISGIVRQLSPS